MKTPVEDFLHSIYAVTSPMLFLVLAFVFKLTYLFHTVFEIPITVLNLLASILLAVPAAWTLLNVSINSYLFKSNVFPILFAICSGIMLLLIFKVIGKDVLHWSEYVKRVFLSIFIATIEYVYSKLFIKKYKEHKLKYSIDPKQLTANLQETTDKLQETITRLQQTEDRLQKANEEIRHAKAHYYCRHCGEEFETPNACKAHESKCEHNTKNQKL